MTPSKAPSLASLCENSREKVSAIALQARDADKAIFEDLKVTLTRLLVKEYYRVEGQGVDETAVTEWAGRAVDKLSLTPSRLYRLFEICLNGDLNELVTRGLEDAEGAAGTGR